MKVGERRIVITNRGVRHPVGTLVEVNLICEGASDNKPYYCQAVDGNTAYWYSDEELAIEIDGLKA